MIVVNFKAYEESTGFNARELSKLCAKASRISGERVISVPQTQDLRVCKGEVFGQHVDPFDPGSHTGKTLAKGLKDTGATGTLINHSENRVNRENIRKSINKCRELDIETIVCGQSAEECGELSKLGPDFIAFEPPKLIGGNVSVSQAEPEMIEKAVELSKRPLLVGAGIKHKLDVEKSIDLGSVGVLVASGVVKSKRPYEELMELCEGL